MTQLPEHFQRDVEKIIKILKASGCTDIYLFGSLVDGNTHENSDIDIAVRGCPKHNFFRVWSKLVMALDHTIDLVDLDSNDRFAKYLQQEGELRKID